MATRSVFRYFIPACLIVAALGGLAGLVLTEGYHGNTLVFTYERYEQILPYTFNPAGREWANHPDSLQQAKTAPLKAKQ